MKPKVQSTAPILNLANRIGGKIEAGAGVVEAALGHAIGNEKMEARGIAHTELGEAAAEASRRAEHVKGEAQVIAGEAKTKAGDLAHDTIMQVDGRMETLAGQVRKALNE